MPDEPTKRKRAEILKAVENERDRQNKLWGGADHDGQHQVNDWIALIAKHAGRAAFDDDPTEFTKQMIKVAALAVAACESI